MSEKHKCRDRVGKPIGPYGDTVNPEDVWDKRPNGDRTCSYCGSLHHDDFLRIVTAAADPNNETTIERSDKCYKWYCRQPGVANASDGGIKFYTWHIVDQEYTDKLNAVIIKAQEESAKKFNAMMDKLFPKKASA